MRKRMSGRTGLFLLELIISIFFFIIASAVCIQLFVKAHVLDRENRELSEAVKLVTNTSEQYYADACGSMERYYNQEFEECSQAEAAYILRVLEVEEERDCHGILYTASVSLRAADMTTPIYAISLTKYKEAENV